MAQVYTARPSGRSEPGLFMNALLRPTIHLLWLCVLAPAPST